jgi:hypothetical protein
LGPWCYNILIAGCRPDLEGAETALPMMRGLGLSDGDDGERDAYPPAVGSGKEGGGNNSPATRE